MSESMSSPWIRDYLVDIAETYGAQLYNAPVSKSKKKVQLTDFLTYQENSYIWVWISDKDHRVPVRISKDAVDKYKGTTYGRSIIDSRFSLIFVSGYRPMFSPRPLGPNVLGNTPVSHISLEVDCVSLMGIGGHLFGSPRDVESDETMKEWVQGLRQDGGGGNVLKLRKQQEQVQNQKALPPPPPPPLFSLSLSPKKQTTKATENATKPKPERSRDFKRVYAKRWQIVELDPWKFTTKPTVKEQNAQTELSQPPVEPSLEPARELETRPCGPVGCPTSLHRTPSPPPLQQQGTPTDWSPSNRGSSIPPVQTNTPTLGNRIQQQDEPEALSTISHPPSDIEEHTAIVSDTRSLQPPTPAQRIKRSPIRRSFSPHRSPPEPFGSPRPSSQFPLSSSPPPSSSLPLPSSSLPLPTGSRKNIQRKVPHPGLPVSRPDPTKHGPVQILVPNSDTSGTGSSQSHSQSRHPSQSQQFQSQLSHPPALPSSLAKEFKPPDTSTPREEVPVSGSRRTSKMFAEPLPIHCNIDEQEITSVDDEHIIEKTHANTGKQKSESNQPPAPSAPKVEVPEIGDSDTEEETDELQLTQTNTDGVVIHRPTEPHEPPGSQSSMHSLFSDSLEDERTASSQVPNLPVGGTEAKVQEKANFAHVLGHDPVAWKEPSFISKNKERDKARAVEELDTVKANKKRRRSTEPETPVSKRAKVAPPQAAPSGISNHVQPQATEAPTMGKTRPSTTLMDTTDTSTPTLLPRLSKPRLANFAVDFERIDLGKGVPTPRLDLGKGIKSMLLRTGRIRTLGELVEKDGSVYIMR